jgi:hypothetical protein
VAGYDEIGRYAELLEEQRAQLETLGNLIDAAPDWQRARLERVVELQRHREITQDDLREAGAAPERRADAVRAMRAHVRITEGHLEHLPGEGDLEEIEDQNARDQLRDMRRGLLRNRAELAGCLDAITSESSGAATVDELVDDSDEGELESAEDLIVNLQDAERLLVKQRQPLTDAQRDTLSHNWLKALENHLPRVASDDEDTRRDNAFDVRVIHDLLIPLQDVLVKATGGSDDHR